jgi:hypothetical protein
MVHRALAVPTHPLVSTVAFRVTASLAKDVVVADGPSAESVGAATVTAPDPQPGGRHRRRRWSRRRPIDTSVGRQSR